jgi:hypothetical protein
MRLFFLFRQRDLILTSIGTLLKPNHFRPAQSQKLSSKLVYAGSNNAGIMSGLPSMLLPVEAGYYLERLLLLQHFLNRGD